MDNTPEKFPELARVASVLVAGHREQRLNGRGDKALATLDRVLARFAEVGRVALADQLFGRELYEGGPATVRILTGDCDGVDARARAAAQRLGLALHVVSAAAPVAEVIPAAMSIHFGCPGDILERDGSAHGMRDELALLHADVLVAVWDGAPAMGNAGGVVRLIQRAIQAGTPVLWIDLDGALRELDYTRIDGRSRFQLANAVFQDVQAYDTGVFGEPIDDPLTPHLRQWLDPLKTAARDDRKPDQAVDTLKMYAHDKAGFHWWERWAGFVDAVFSAVVLFPGGELAKAFNMDATRPYFDSQPGMTLPEPLRARMAWTDVRANVAAGRHRSRIWLLYLLSAFAVFAAVAGALHLAVEHEGWQSFVWPGIEAVVLGTILVLVLGARKKRWHARWLGQRLMTEQLRNLAMTRPFLGLAPFFALPPFAPGERAGTLALRNVEAWLLRRALIVEGVPGENGRYHLHGIDQARLAQSLGALVGSEKSGQIGHHHKKAHHMEHLKHRMHIIAIILFGASLAAVAYHLIAPWWDLPEVEALLFATAFLPALAASLHGIQTKLEFERLQAQSLRTGAELGVMRTVIDGFGHVPHPDTWQRTLYLRAAALQAAHVMSDEVQAWRDLIAVQDSGLPA